MGNIRSEKFGLLNLISGSGLQRRMRRKRQAWSQKRSWVGM